MDGPPRPERRSPWPGAGAADDLVALGEQPRTRRELAIAAGGVERAIRAAGARRLILASQDRYHVAAALLGAWRAEAVVMLPPSLRPATVRALAASRRAELVLCDDGALGADLRAILEGAARAVAAGAVPAPRDGEAIVPPPDQRPRVTVFTSGTTGESVSCPKTGAQLLGEAALLARLFGLEAGARVLTTAPPHHLYGLLFGVLAPLLGGGAFVRAASPLPAEIAAQARRWRANVLCAVPSHLAGLAALDASDLADVERVFCSGGPLDAATRLLLAARFSFALTEIFGSSETGGIACRDGGLREGQRAGEAPWQPLPGVRVAVDPDGHLLLDSPFLAPGAPRPFPCADRIRLHPDGTFHHAGRADDVLKIGGQRVSRGAVEETLRAVAGVRDAAILDVFTGGPRQWELWAAVVAPEHDAQSLRRALLPALEPVAVPRRFVLLEALPRQESGKLRREDLLGCFERAAARPGAAGGES